MNKVTAVFQCTKKEETSNGTELAFTPPYNVDTKPGEPHAPDGSDRERWKRVNEDWSPYTPCGSLTMTVNGAAAASFERDGIYLLTFERFPFEQHGG